MGITEQNIEESDLTLENLSKRISNYKEKKPGHSGASLGMFFKTFEQLYFFDTGTGKVLKIDERLYRFLYELLFRNSDIEQLNKIVKEEELNIEEILDYIKKEDLLVGTGGDQLYNEEIIKKAKNEIGEKCQMLILELTGACNLRCKYCIYNSSEKGFREFHSESISEKIIKKSIDYMKKHGDKEIYISFYGGEPLLRFDLMKYAIEYARENLKEKDLYFGFTTNLTRMTKEIASYLVKVPNLSIVCSIDGPEDIHDASRVYVDGRGTYQDAMRGLETLKNELQKEDNQTISIKFNAVYMAPYKKENLYKIDQNFQKLCDGLPNSNYSMTYPSPGSIPEELKEYDTNDHSMWDWMREQAIECEDMEQLKDKDVVNALSIIHDRILTKEASPTIPMNGCCIPGTRRLYIDTKGDMYVCERINRSPKLGNILLEFDSDLVMKKYIYEYSEHSMKHCANCWAAKMCPVCYADRMDENGISELAHVHCKEYRELIKKRFSLYHEILEKEPEKLDLLNSLITK